MRSSRLVAASLVGVVASGLAVSTVVPASAVAATHTGPASLPAPPAASPTKSQTPATGRTLTLPAPHGRYATGESTFRLVDDKRPDPWDTTKSYRELMISVFYPAVHTGGQPSTPQFPAQAAAVIGTAAEQNFSLPAGLVNWAATRTHSVRDAQMAPGHFPVVLYSPGAGDARDTNVTLVENLAAQGYIVVTIDHTGEAAATEFPDGHIVGNSIVNAAFAKAYQDGTTFEFFTTLMNARQADTELVLNRLPSLPGRLVKGMDLNRIGMFGHSAGGFTAANEMSVDPRIKAGVDMDGTLEYTVQPDGTHMSDVALHGLKQPFLLIGSSSAQYGSDIHREPSWASFWKNQTGWKADFTMNDSEHHTLTDYEALLPQLAGPVDDATLTADLGKAKPPQAVAADRALVDSFFNRFLKGCDDRLLDGPTSRYPITYEQ